MRNKKFAFGSSPVSLRDFFLLRNKKSKLILVAFLVLTAFVFAFSVRSYFSSQKGALGNKVSMANLDLEVTEENGSVLAPFEFSDIYPGWDREVRGKIRNTGSMESIFRSRIQNGNPDFEILANAVLYSLTVENETGAVVYSKEGYLGSFNEDNHFMNITINPEDYFVYSLVLSIPFDMDDYTTPENEVDDQYQGKDAQFDFVIQSTQAGNDDWAGSVNRIVFPFRI